MKKLTVSLALVLTASILMSSSAFAALKPKSEAKATPKASASEKSDDTAATTGKTMTIMRSSPKSPYVYDKNGTESITLENVVATKKEKVTIVGWTDGNTGKASTYTTDATIYEIPAGSKLTITSTPPKGYNVQAAFITYKHDAKGSRYVKSDIVYLDRSEVTFGEGDIGWMFDPYVNLKPKDAMGAYPPKFTCGFPGAAGNVSDGKADVFIRVVAAK